MKRITIDPITRLEGHGKIEIFLDTDGNVDNAFFQIPELRGFEKFCQGRPAEEMPRITEKICGVCPTAHHMASTKALDSLYDVKPTPTARKLRELIYNAFMAEDHALHFYYLGAPDFIVGPTANKAERNILGVIGKVGLEIAGQLINFRKEVRKIISLLGGSVLHPIFGLPGGVSRGMKEEERQEIAKLAKSFVEFGQFSLKAFNDIVLSNKEYVDLITGDIYYHKTNYMGLVDENNKVTFYDGDVKVVSPTGKEVSRFKGKDYLDHIKEHVEKWSYIKFPYLSKIGWKGFVDGEDSGVYRVAPLARLNVADGMATPLAQEEYEKFFSTLGGKPVHNTLAYHWARLIEMLQAVETIEKLINDKEITSPDIRNLPTKTPVEGVGVVEAPRGILYHHYKTDERGIIEHANLIVATVSNSAPMCMGITKTAKALIKNNKYDDGILNMIEMTFRSYDPCLGCATHSLHGEMPLIVNIYDHRKELCETIKRD